MKSLAHSAVMHNAALAAAPLSLVSESELYPQQPPNVQTVMSLSEFMSIPEFQGQRRSADHADAFFSSPLYDPDHPTIAKGFAIGVLPNGVRFRVNGNTRVFGKTHGYDINLPVSVHVDAYHVATMEELLPIYEGYDNGLTSKKAKDKLVTAMNMKKLIPESPFFYHGRGTSGIMFAEGVKRGMVGAATSKNVDLQDVVGFWKEPIAWSDAHYVVSKGPVAQSAPVIAGMLVTYKLEPANAARFWNGFHASRGNEGDSKIAWNRLWHQIRVTIKDKGGSRDATWTALAHVLYAYEHGVKVSKKDSKVWVPGLIDGNGTNIAAYDPSKYWHYKRRGVTLRPSTPSRLTLKKASS